MDRFTTFGVGGKADIIAYPQDRADLRKIHKLAKEKGVSAFMIGLGSNLLVKDRGIRGVVISLSKGLRTIKTLPGDRLYCEAGLTLAGLAAFAANNGLGGLEFLSGVPGTVGGALRMNAGAFGGEIKDVIEDVSFMNCEGEIKTVYREDVSFSYREMQTGAEDTIISCTLALFKKDIKAIREEMKKIALLRSETQPLNKATAGSVFKNPPGNSAGRLIDEAGLKGVQVGQAKISTKHANFIENLGGASAADIMALMELMKDRVYKKSGISLEAEVKIVGQEDPNKIRVLQ
ncbi:MAG: UDP-N-acetylmuramate dehydrogenase [Proteobacteria bacterium]|nr:UDP-N-acetylmuramate dehydrogenase [Pseudomonadota bacterium]